MKILHMFLKKEKVEKYSGVNINLHKHISSLRKGYWEELKITVDGDAPKNFIYVYSFERNSAIRRNNHKSWPKYIAKVGHKWYPLESINEFLFNRIGEVLNLNMASSRLMMAKNQLRFLSKYFLNRNESLEHGAQIFSGYIEDEEWVEGIERDGLARKFFTFQFAGQAISHTFPHESESLMLDLVKMLIFDSILGNNDRHYYNWGIIKHIENKKSPIFAPIFDSARGLFWNDSEQKLMSWLDSPNEVDNIIKRYAEGSKPKIGWDGVNDLNHFDLILKIFNLETRYKQICNELLNQENLDKVLHLLRTEFSKFYSVGRLSLIEKCITYRFTRLIQITRY